MRIAFLNIYQGTVDRGAENFVKEISIRLAKKHGISLFYLKGLKESTARSQTPLNFFGKVLYKLWLDKHSLRVLNFTLRNLHQLIFGNYDWIIPVDGGWQVLLIKILKVLKLTRAKILISGQAGIGRDDLRNLKIGPDIFVALTKRAEEWARQINPKVKVVYIPNGADLRVFNPKVKAKDLNLEKPIIICVAGLNPYKRVDLSIEAVSKLGKGSLLVLGDGPQKENIDDLGKNLLGDKKFLRKTVNYEEMPAYYNSAKVFTLVSESSEAFGSAYIEAMACNLPVVATDDIMRNEIIGEAGLFVNPENIQEYTNTLKKALDKDWGAKPRQQAEKFSWDKIAEEYEFILSQNESEV